MAKLPVGLDELFKGRHFEREIIILCVRWYLRFKLSFRDLVEMMAERGLSLPKFEPQGILLRADSETLLRARDKINELFLSSLRRGFLNDGCDGVVPVAVKFVVLDVEFV